MPLRSASQNDTMPSVYFHCEGFIICVIGVELIYLFVQLMFTYLYNSYYVYVFSCYDPCYFSKHVRNPENVFYNTYFTELMFIRTLLIHDPFGKLSSYYSKIK